MDQLSSKALKVNTKCRNKVCGMLCGLVVKSKCAFHVCGSQAVVDLINWCMDTLGIGQ